ncbi:MAG: hypothetical protein HC897_16470 [Thermoanaerobaculia bacterium]|nr:hypothetical protein [Thermoanaerobaculia bacterium]
MRFFSARVGWLLACSLSVGLMPAGAQVTDLVVTDSGADAVLTWTTGTPPFRVLRTDNPAHGQRNRFVAEGISGFSVIDVGAIGPGVNDHFYVVLGDGDPFPDWAASRTPIRPPVITAISPATGLVGDVVTIDGGNFEASLDRIRVAFNAEDAAEILSATPTQIVAVVPPGTVTGGMGVCCADECSNDVLFTRLLAKGFQDISSLAFEPGTGSLWVADRGSGGRVYEVPPEKKPVRRGALADPVLAHPSPADGSGRIYYASGGESAESSGTINYVDSRTNGEGAFAQPGGSTSADAAMRCEAIAANDLEPDVVYCLDGSSGGILRIERGVITDARYGNRTFTFNSPAGARFDTKGNLFVSAMTAVFKILPREAEVIEVLNGFTAAAGLDLCEEWGDWEEYEELLVVDEATNTLWMADAKRKDKWRLELEIPLLGPVAVTSSRNSVTGLPVIDVAEPTRILRLPY